VNLLTLARDLQRRKAREKHSLFVAEGVRAVEDLLRSGLKIRGALVTSELAGALQGQSLRNRLDDSKVKIVEVTVQEFATAAETESPQGVLAVAEIPVRSFNTLRLPPECRIIVLDAVQDPGNVGTIIRTAAALGAAATIALPGTVDIWNSKVVRSSMGAQFEHPAFYASWNAARDFLSKEHFQLWATDASGEPVARDRAVRRLAIVVGNEGSGVNPEIRAGADKIVSLPIAAGVESLNVAVATGIILYALRQ
jgi:RNA methyltransferase, TrmH family